MSEYLQGWAIYDNAGHMVAVSPFTAMAVIIDVAEQEGIELPGIDGTAELDSEGLWETLKAKGFTEGRVHIYKT